MSSMEHLFNKFRKGLTTVGERSQDRLLQTRMPVYLIPACSQNGLMRTLTKYRSGGLWQRIPLPRKTDRVLNSGFYREFPGK
jgi:hypothetical protein